MHAVARANDSRRHTASPVETGEHYAGELVRELFRKQGITYDLAEDSKSELYLACMPLLNATRVQLLDLPRLASQFTSLERRTSRSGRDTLDHVAGGHDDLANSVAGALLLAKSERKPMTHGRGHRPPSPKDAGTMKAKSSEQPHFRDAEQRALSLKLSAIMTDLMANTKAAQAALSEATERHNAARRDAAAANAALADARAARALLIDAMASAGTGTVPGLPAAHQAVM